jgi:hypothetical protein
MERPDDKNPRCCCAAVPVQNKSVPKMAQVPATFMDHLEATHSHIYNIIYIWENYNISQT